MEIIIRKKIAKNKPLLDNNEKKSIWKRARGVWKDKKPDPIIELKKIKKGWSR